MPLRVLFAEDEDRVAVGIGYGLQDAGHDVLHVADGLEALDQFEGFGPDVLLTDIDMPRLDGLELVRRLRLRRPDLPVVILSGCSTQHADAMEEGAFERLVKPTSVEAILTAVERVAQQTVSAGYTMR